jgi:hypothetical protein
MAIFKLILQYTEGDKGFQEVFYRPGVSAADAANVGTSFITASLRCRSPFTVLRKIHASDVTNNRVSVVVPINRARVTSFPGTPDLAGVAAVCTLVGISAGANRRLWLRGLIDDDTLRNASTGVDNPSPVLRENIGLYIQAMSDIGLQIQFLKKLGTPPLVYTTIASVERTIAGRVTIHTVDAWAPTASGRVILTLLDQKLWPALQGAFAASAIDDHSFSVAYNSHLANGLVPVTKGRTRPQEYDYTFIQATLSGFDHFGTRDTGRNPLGGRGRRSVRILRSA